MTCIHYRNIIDGLRNKIKILENERMMYINFSSSLVGVSSELSNALDSLTLLGNLFKEIILNGAPFDDGSFLNFGNELSSIISEIGALQGAISACIAEINNEISELQNKIASYAGRDCAACQAEDEDNNNNNNNGSGGGR